MTDLVACSREGHVLVLTLNRPERRNVLDVALTAALDKAVRAADLDPSIRAMVLSGAGPDFCAGADLALIRAGRGVEICTATETWAGFVSLPRTTPVIAAVHGRALAGGLELALACDLVVAADSAEFGLPEVSLGLVATAGGAIRLPQAAPPKRAMEILLTGRRFDAREAYDLGLVTRLTSADGVLDEACRLAQAIASNAPLAISETLAIARQAVETDALAWERSAQAWRRLATTEDAIEGASAFFEGRAPRWSGL